MDGLVATADGTRRVATKFHAAADGHSTIGRGRAHLELTGVEWASQQRLRRRRPQTSQVKKGRSPLVCFESTFVVLFFPRSYQAAVRDGAPPRPPLENLGVPGRSPGVPGVVVEPPRGCMQQAYT